MSNRGRYNFRGNRGRGRGKPQSANQNWRDHEEKPAPVAPPPPTFKPKTQSQLKRDNERKDAFRRKTGEEEMAKLAKELDKKLCFGFINMDEAAVRQKIELQKRAIILPVSTRGIGFYSQSILTKIHQTYNNVPACTPYELYRASLAQASYRLKITRRDQLGNTIANENLYVRHRLTSDQQEALMGMRLSLSPIANAINAIGNQSVGGTEYYFPYNFVRIKFCNALPHPSTLTKWYQSVDGAPGFSREAPKTSKNKSSKAVSKGKKFL
ncbi:hypothetical protein ILUMI_19204, partial [Ignelater luminosus]